MVGVATLQGSYVDVRSSVTVATLRPIYLDEALRLGFDDFDAAALKRAYPRDLTHRLAVDFYEAIDADGSPTYDGVHFGSRHGDDLALWAIYERPGDYPLSRNLGVVRSGLVDANDADLARAMALHHLTWR